MVAQPHYNHFLKASLWYDGTAISRLHNCTSPVLFAFPLGSNSGSISTLLLVLVTHNFSHPSRKWKYISHCHSSPTSWSRSQPAVSTLCAHVCLPEYAPWPSSSPNHSTRHPTVVMSERPRGVSCIGFQPGFAICQAQKLVTTLKTVREILNWFGLRSKERREDKCHNILHVLKAKVNHTKLFLSTQQVTFFFLNFHLYSWPSKQDSEASLA